MGVFRVVEGGELSGMQMERVLATPFSASPKPNAVRESFRDLLEGLKTLGEKSYNFFFMFNDDRPVARLMVKVDYSAPVDGVLGFEHVWANETASNRQFLQLTRASGKGERTIFEELFVRGLHWGLSHGCKHPVMPPYHSNTAEKAWNRFVEKGYVKAGRTPFENEFGRVPQPLDLGEIQKMRLEVLHDQILSPPHVQGRHRTTNIP